MTSLEEVYSLHELNVQLLDTLLVIGQRFIEYIDKYEIAVEGRENLATLIGRAQRLVEEIGTPYRRNPIISDERYHNDSDHSSDDEVPKPTTSNA